MESYVQIWAWQFPSRAPKETYDQLLAHDVEITPAENGVLADGPVTCSTSAINLRERDSLLCCRAPPEHLSPRDRLMEPGWGVLTIFLSISDGESQPDWT